MTTKALRRRLEALEAAGGGSGITVVIMGGLASGPPQNARMGAVTWRCEDGESWPAFRDRVTSDAPTSLLIFGGLPR
jgi:hypothetical protein